MEWENKQLLSTDNRNYWASEIKKNVPNTYQATVDMGCFTQLWTVSQTELFQTWKPRSYYPC